MPDGTQRNSQDSAALLLIEVINHFECRDGERILRHAMAVAARIALLKQRARAAGIPTICANDNFGDRRSDAGEPLGYCLRHEAAGRAFVEKDKPDPQEYFVLKPMHSAFYQAPLEVLPRHLGASSLIFTGLTTNSCILCSAHDTNMRDLKSVVAVDCCTARSRREHHQALGHIRVMADAKLLSASALHLRRFVEKARR